MAKPTYTASIVGKEKANAAFKRSGKTQEFFAGVSGTHRQLISKFLRLNRCFGEVKKGRN